MMQIIAPQCSIRGMAHILELAFHIDYFDALHEAMGVQGDADTLPKEAVALALKKLQAAGYDQWLIQYGRKS